MSVASWCCKSFCVVPCAGFCTGHFVMVPLNMTCLHCLQHSLFVHLFNLYWLHKVGGWYGILIRDTRRKHDTGFSIQPVVYVSWYCIQIIDRYIIKKLIKYKSICKTHWDFRKIQPARANVFKQGIVYNASLLLSSFFSSLNSLLYLLHKLKLWRKLGDITLCILLLHLWW